MNPNEVTAKLADVDAKIAAKLAELGFTPEQAARQMDRLIPEDVRKAEAEEILACKFSQDLADPSSGHMDKLMEHVAAELERSMPELERQARENRARRRRNQLVLAGIAVAAIGAGVWYFAIRDARSTCEKLVDADTAGAILGMKLRSSYSYADKYHCSLSFSEMMPGGDLIRVEIENPGDISYNQSSLDKKRFARTENLPFAKGMPARLYIADVVAGPSTEELMARAVARVGKTRDPIGSVLGDLPPSHHTLLFELGTSVGTIQLSNTKITPEQAKQFAVAMAKRAGSI
jgi:hypothetical protein